MATQPTARTFASFQWQINIRDEDLQPYAADEVRELVASFCAAGRNLTDLEDQEYAWGFSAELQHLRIECQLGMIGNSGRWLLACLPCRGFASRLLGQTYEEELEEFLCLLDGGLRANEKIKNLRWFTKQEWDEFGE